MPNVEVEVIVNGERRRVEVDPERSLLGVIREELHLYGADGS